MLVVGASTGGVAAAHEAASLGANVCLTEETDWLGGQFTTQGVPLDTGDLDDSLTMSAYLDAVRASYRASYPAWPAGRTNPGECGRANLLRAQRRRERPRGRRSWARW